MMVYFNDVVLLLTVSMNINWSERFDDKIINWSVYKCMCVYVVQIGGFLYLFRQQWISPTTTVRITRREKANGWKEMSLLSKHFVRSFFFVEIMADRFLAATLILLTPSFTQMLHTHCLWLFCGQFKELLCMFLFDGGDGRGEILLGGISVESVGGLVN